MPIRRIVVTLALSCVISTSAVAQFGIRTILDSPAATAPSGDARKGVTFDANVMGTLPKEAQAKFEACKDASGNAVMLNRVTPTAGSSANAKCFWQQNGAELLKNARLVNSDGSAAIAAEVVADFSSGWRFALSTAVASPPKTGTTDDDAEVAKRNLNLLAANGGNLSVLAQYPLYGNRLKHGYLFLNSYQRFGGNFTPFGESDETFATKSLTWKELNGSSESTVELHLAASTEAKQFQFVSYSKISVIAGTKLFNKAVGNNGATGFVHGQIGGGIRLDLLTVAVTYNWYSADKIPGRGAFVNIGISR